jgi:hypothetical protein
MNVDVYFVAETAQFRNIAPWSWLVLAGNTTHSIHDFPYSTPCLATCSRASDATPGQAFPHPGERSAGGVRRGEGAFIFYLVFFLLLLLKLRTSSGDSLASTPNVSYIYLAVYRPLFLVF